MSGTIHWARMNVTGLISLAVAAGAFALNAIPGLVLLGWLLAPVGVVLAVAALVGAPSRTRKEAVAALIVSLASVFAAVVMFRDYIAPALPPSL